MELKPYEYELTEAGLKRLDHISDELDLQSSEEYDLLMGIHTSARWIIQEKEYPMLDRLVRSGYVMRKLGMGKEGRYGYREILGRLPLSIRSPMKIYINIAEGKVVSEKDVDLLGNWILGSIKDPFGKLELESSTSGALDILRSPTSTKKEKILSIDTLIWAIHNDVLDPSFPEASLSNFRLLLDKLCIGEE